ncbi:YagK/YfjJ domain-containing protein [Rahnella contaminans]|uniref:YagK/YfjJ domain-containing protein n=1 Tax=Rahnella contaminans TaxID=2703882 RepID=UPI0023DB9B6B|nr:inovirus-type Gp2 protein [Rahnella contaminans]MDF1895548.1 inovirus-type Gp2 protein [Rahnella contaminans]
MKKQPVATRKKGRFKLISSDSFEHRGTSYPVNCTRTSDSPLSTEILSRNIDELLAMQESYARVFAFRFDLHVPSGMTPEESNKCVSELFEKLRDKFKAKGWDNQPIKTFAYGWVFEIGGKTEFPHYHLWIAVPGSQVQAVYPAAGVYGIIKNLWSELANGKGYLPDNAGYMITRDDKSVLKEFVYRISYVAKEKGKYSQSNKTKRYGGSRLHGKNLNNVTNGAKVIHPNG